MATKRISELPLVTQGASDVMEVSRPSGTVTLTGATLSALASDNSINDSAAGFIAAGFLVGMSVRVQGFAAGASNIYTGRITALTAGKMTIGGTDGDAIVDEAAGASVTVRAWASAHVAAPVPLDVWAFACSDLATALTTGAGKGSMYAPYAATVIEVACSLDTPQVSGSLFTVNLKEAGTTILSTKLTLDNTEGHSSTAATPPVISDASIAKGAKITADIDQIGNGTAKGLVVYLTVRPA